MAKKKGRRDKSDLNNEKEGSDENESSESESYSGSDDSPKHVNRQAQNEEASTSVQIDPDLLLKEYEQENKYLKEQLLRKQAEFENFRKRLNREKDDSIRYANQMLLLDIVTVLDDFERAIKSADDSQDFNAFHSGIVLIEKQCISMLENKWGLSRFESKGQLFDPDRHQAIAAEESGEYEKPTVLEDYQKGYLYHERVLRPAKVKVAQPIIDPDGGDSESEKS